MSAIAASAAGIYNADPAHSHLGFEVKHMGIATVRGSFKEFTGSVEIDADGRVAARGTVQVASVDTGTAQRDEHLRSEDFFDAQTHPQISFASKHSTLDGESIEIVGDITIKGVTKEIVLRGELAENGQDPWGNERVGVEVKGKLDRRDFGLTWNQALAAGGLLVANEVKLVLSISAVKAA